MRADRVRSRGISHPRYDHDVSNNREYRSLEGDDVISTRYYYPLVRVNGSDLVPFTP